MKKQSQLSYFDVVRIVLGSVLVVASFLKGFDLLTDPLAGHDFLGPRWLLIVLVGFEWGLGLWLLAGFHPRLTRWVAIACFAVFAGTTLTMALAGESSCGCFGRVRVSPWLTLSFDLAAVGALLSFPPNELARGKWTIVLFRHNCSACASAIPRYEEMARKAINDPDAPRIALIEIPPYADPNERVVSSESLYKLGRLEQTRSP